MLEHYILRAFLVAIAALLVIGLVQHGVPTTAGNIFLIGAAAGVIAYPLWQAIGWRNAFRIGLVIVVIAIVRYLLI